MYVGHPPDNAYTWQPGAVPRSMARTRAITPLGDSAKWRADGVPVGMSGGSARPSLDSGVPT
jgi:hypothetical protein